MAISPQSKVARSVRKIQEFMSGVDHMAYVAFSGGLDSRVLLDLVRTECGLSRERVPAVFVDTGLEYPDVREVALRHADVVLKPKMSYGAVVKKYGFPVVSKAVAMAVYKIRTSKSEFCKQHYLTGITHKGHGKAGMLPAKWRRLLEAPFPISHCCCDVLKKRPAAKYERESGRWPMLGIRVEDSRTRRQLYSQRGSCNGFGKRPSGWPMAIWTDADVLWYVRDRGLDYAAQYDNGSTGSGCFACMFGIHMEPGENRFQRMYRENQKMWKACMDGFGCRQVMEFLNIPIMPERDLLDIANASGEGREV